jgi:hypothetical protein
LKPLNPTGPSRGSIRRIVLQGATVGLALFLVQDLALWSAWLAPAAGTQPLFHLRNCDVCQYLGYLAMPNDGMLFPDLNAPWLTEPALLTPLFLIAGRLGGYLGASPVTVLNVLQLLLYLGAGCVLVWVLYVFLETRAQRAAAVSVALCAMPLTMLLFGTVRWVVPAASGLFWQGTLTLSYMSADGLLRGGLSNSPTLTFGSAMLLLALGFTGLRLVTGRRIFVLLLAVTTMISALVHPFEVFVIVPAMGIAFLLLQHNAWLETVPVAAGAAAGLAPHLLLLLRHQWLRDLSQSFSYAGSFGHIAFTYGLAFLAIPCLLLLRAWPQEQKDKLLLIWWLVTIGVSLLPHAPFPRHLLDGFAVVTGLLVVRLAVSHQKLGTVFRSHRRMSTIVLGCVLLLAGIAYAQMYAQIVIDGRSNDPELLYSAVAADDEIAVVDEFRRRRLISDLVLAPEPLSILLVQSPMHSFASHDHLSLDYRRQRDESARFYGHKLTTNEAHAFLADYGIRWVVVPDGCAATKYFAGRREAFSRGIFHIFELPENHLKAYPGIVAILPPPSSLTPN